MEGVKITKSNGNETIFTIQDNITVTLVAEAFNKNGEMLVEFDDNIMTEEEATNTVNKYFEDLLASLEQRKAINQINELKKTIGEIK